MESSHSWGREFIKMEKEVETTAETKPKMKAQIPFLADLIKLEKQSTKSEANLSNEGCSSWVCKDEIKHEEETELGKDFGHHGPYVVDNKIHIKKELCSSNWSCLIDSQKNVQEIKSQCDIQHSQLVGQDAFSETWSEQARNIEQIKEETEDSEIIDDNIEDTAETTENRDLHLSITSRGQGGNQFPKKALGNEACSKLSQKALGNEACSKLSQKALGNEACSKLSQKALGNEICSSLSENYCYVSKRGTNCVVNSVSSENLDKYDFPGESCANLYLVSPNMGDSEKSYKCGECGKQYCSNKALTTHKRRHKKDKSYKCDVCGKEFNMNHKLTLHKRIHTGEWPYKCDDCGKGCNTNWDLIIHKRSHTGEKPYKCDVCGKGCSRSSVLIRHKRTHTGEKHYKCDVCGKECNDITVHKRIHTGEKPYKCDVCGKGFVSKSKHNAHKIIHTRDSPYKCDVCGKMFSEGSRLKVHKRTHTGEKPYKCDVCCKMFGHASMMKGHIRTHTGEKPYKCDICDSHFAYLYILKKHISSSHL